MVAWKTGREAWKAWSYNLIMTSHSHAKARLDQLTSIIASHQPSQAEWKEAVLQALDAIAPLKSANLCWEASMPMWAPVFIDSL